MRHALAEASWHVAHRSAFGGAARRQAADAERDRRPRRGVRGRHRRWRSGWRPPSTGRTDPHEAALRRIALPLAKFWVCKRTPMMVAEALECLGGNGYVEESGMPLLFRESPLNSIWEGSGNVNALDVLRALGREPEVLEAWLTEVGLAQGEDPRLDRAIEGVLGDARRHHHARGLRPPARRPDGRLPPGLAAAAVRSPGDRRRVLRHPARRRLQRHARHAPGRHRPARRSSTGPRRPRSPERRTRGLETLAEASGASETQRPRAPPPATSAQVVGRPGRTRRRSCRRPRCPTGARRTRPTPWSTLRPPILAPLPGASVSLAIDLLAGPAAVAVTSSGDEGSPACAFCAPVGRARRSGRTPVAFPAIPDRSVLRRPSTSGIRPGRAGTTRERRGVAETPRDVACAGPLSAQALSAYPGSQRRRRRVRADTRDSDGRHALQVLRATRAVQRLRRTRASACFGRTCAPCGRPGQGGGDDRASAWTSARWSGPRKDSA